MTVAALAAAGCGDGGSSGPSAADWNDLARSIRGKVILPGDPLYPSLRLTWNGIYDRVLPQAIVRVADERDVATAVRFAADTGVQPTARSGAHSFAGFSSSTGMIIDVGALNAAHMTPDRSSVRAGAGATILDVYRETWNGGQMAIAGGLCPTVGLAGLTLGAGYGMFCREYGMTCDRLVEAQIVTADGQLRTANASENADLFWASRGGGGGNFGVVTSLTYVPIPADRTANHTSLVFPWSVARRALAEWQAWALNAPYAAWTSISLRTQSPYGEAEPTIRVEAWHMGPAFEAERLVDELISAVGVPPTLRTDYSGPFLQVKYDEYCAGFKPEECAIQDRTPQGKFPRRGYHSTSDIMMDSYPEPAAEVIVDAVERRQRQLAVEFPAVPDSEARASALIEPADGAVNRMAPDATAFPFRRTAFIAQFGVRVPVGAPHESVDTAVGWCDDLRSALTPWRSGYLYVNYPDRAVRDWGNAYYAGNFDRLREIKARRDPCNLFRFPQSIPPARA